MTSIDTGSSVPHSPTPPLSPSPPARRYNLPKKLHLRSPADFAAVFDAKARENRGPLAVNARPNGLPHPRLGMSVSRKVGNAVKRNRIRRLIREAFRLMQHDLPTGYDLVVVVRPHAPLMLADYQRLLSGAAVKLHNVWKRRGEAKATSAPPITTRDGPPPSSPGTIPPCAAS